MASKRKNSDADRCTSKQIKTPTLVHMAIPASSQSVPRRSARLTDKALLSSQRDGHDVEQVQNVLDPIRFDDDGTPVHIIEGILDSTIIKGESRKSSNGCIHDMLYYLVKWEGWDEPTWQPYDDLVGCDQAIADFHRRYPHTERLHTLFSLPGVRLSPSPSVSLSEPRLLSPKVVIPAKNRNVEVANQPTAVLRKPQMWEIKLNAKIAARRRQFISTSESGSSDYSGSTAAVLSSPLVDASLDTSVSSPASYELPIHNSTSEEPDSSHLLSFVREFEYTCFDSLVRIVDGHRLISLGENAAKDLKILASHLRRDTHPSLRLHIRFQYHKLDQQILPWRLDLSVLDHLPGLEKLDVVCSPLDLFTDGTVQQLVGFNAAIKQELYRLGDRVLFWRHLQSECVEGYISSMRTIS